VFRFAFRLVGCVIILVLGTILYVGGYIAARATDRLVVFSDYEPESCAAAFGAYQIVPAEYLASGLDAERVPLTGRALWILFWPLCAAEGAVRRRVEGWNDPDDAPTHTYTP
jgi:hypothetical protein